MNNFVKGTNTLSISIPYWGVEEFCGYVPKTTFWQDFSIADAFGAPAVIDTYERAFAEWKTDYIYFTELVMVLNHKIWQHYETNNDLATVYNKLWDKANCYAKKHFKGEEGEYYYQVTD